MTNHALLGELVKAGRREADWQTQIQVRIMLRELVYHMVGEARGSPDGVTEIGRIEETIRLAGEADVIDDETLMALELEAGLQVNV